MGLIARLLGRKPAQKKQPTKVHQPVKPESNWEPVTVKIFFPKRGYGFLSRGDGKPDIYVHLTTLERCHIKTPKEGMRLDVKWGKTPKGFEAAEVRPSK